MKNLKTIQGFLNESLGAYDYDKWIKENGKIKWPSWVTKTRKEIVKAGLMDKVYDNDRFNMTIWMNSFGKDIFNINADSKKREKTFGKVGSKFINAYYNDIYGGYSSIFWNAANIALELSKGIEDKVNNEEEVEPAYYIAKEYFNNFEIETNRSRLFDSTVKKLEEWMKENKVKTL